MTGTRFSKLTVALLMVVVGVWVGLGATSSAAQDFPEKEQVTESENTTSTTTGPAATIADDQSETVGAGGFVWCDDSKTSWCVPCSAVPVGSAVPCVPGSTSTRDSVLLPITPTVDPLSSTGPQSDVWALGGLRTNYGTNAIPLFNYEIGAGTDAFLGVPDPIEAVLLQQTNALFGIGVVLTSLAVTLLDWAFSFPISDAMLDRSGILARSYAVDFFGFGLETSVYRLALSVTVAVAAFKAVARNALVGLVEVFLGVAAFVLMMVITLTSSFGDLGMYVTGTASDLSGGVASFAAGEEQRAECAATVAAPSLAGASAASGESGISTSDRSVSPGPACTFGHALQASLVERPYQIVQWGQVLDGVPGLKRCAAMNHQLLAEGRHGTDDRPRDQMASLPECEQLAEFNGQITTDRWMMAGFNLFSQVMVSLLILLVGGAIFWEQVKVLLLTILLPHALVFAILPGVARRTAFNWLWSMLGVLLTTVGLAVGLVVWLSLYRFLIFDIATARGFFLSLFGSIVMAFGGFGFVWKVNRWSRRIAPASGKWVENATVNAVHQVDGGLGAAWRQEKRPGRGLTGIAAYSMMRDYNRARYMGRRVNPFGRRTGVSRAPGPRRVRPTSPGSGWRPPPPPPPRPFPRSASISMMSTR